MPKMRSPGRELLLRVGLASLLITVASACQMHPQGSSGQPSKQAAGTQEMIRLAEVPFGEMSFFEAGLVPLEQGAPEGLPGASYYKVDIEISEDLSLVEGQLEVQYTNREPQALDEIYFRLFPNILGGETGVERVQIGDEAVPTSMDESGSILRLSLGDPLQPGQALVASMNFRVDVPTHLDRNYGVLAVSEGVLALAHFYPMIPAYDDEGWNVEIPPPYGDVVYADASFFLVSVTAPDELTIVASGELVQHVANAGLQQVLFAAGPARDFYLVASEDLAKQTGQFGETRVNSYGPTAFPEASQRVLRYAAQAAATFNELYARYPYRELDLVATPTLALGIEYPGALAIAQRMYDPETMEYPESVLESTVAHEVAHQWFYGMVGNDQLDEPWLDEALAQYLTLVYFRRVRGEAAAAGFHASFIERWERVDRADIPIGLPVSSYPGTEYGAIVYGRGPLFMEALAKAMDDEDLTRFLNAYLSAYKWQNVDTMEFRALAEETCDCDLGALFTEYVYER
jgi:hypothetical protein